MSHAQHERRRSIRFCPRHAKAVCSTRHAGGVYTIEDVSCGGILLEGGTAVPPGTRVALRVMVPGADPMDIGGKVMRSSPGFKATSRLAVRFSNVSADTEDRVADLIALEWSKVCGPRCVVASSSPRVRRELTRRIEALGGRVSRARTPIELIQRVEACRGGSPVVFLGATIGGCTAEEAASFLSDMYPHVRRVLVTAPKLPDKSIAARGLDEVLDRPWTDKRLKQILSFSKKVG